MLFKLIQNYSKQMLFCAVVLLICGNFYRLDATDINQAEQMAIDRRLKKQASLKKEWEARRGISMESELSDESKESSSRSDLDTNSFHWK